VDIAAPDRQASFLRRVGRHWRLYLYIFPTIALLLTFSYYPAISALYHAFFEWEPFGDEYWVGLTNFRVLYADLFQPQPALRAAAMTAVQAVGWGAMLAFVGFFLLTERIRERSWSGVRLLATLPGAVAAVLALTALGLTVARHRSSFYGTGYFEIAFGHIGRLALFTLVTVVACGFVQVRRGGWLAMPAGIVAAAVQARYIRHILVDLPQIEPDIWACTAAALKYAPWLLAACCVLSVVVRLRSWKAIGIWAGAVWMAGAIVTIVSLIVGLTGGGAGQLADGGLLGHFLFGHLAVLALAAGQMAGWLRQLADRPRMARGLLCSCTAAVICFAIGLLISVTQGSELREATWNLVRVMTFHLSVGLFMPLLIAEVLFHLRSDRWKYGYRVLFIIPMVVPGIVGVLMWQFIYNYKWGVLNQFINLFRRPETMHGTQLFFLVAAYAVALYLIRMRQLARLRAGRGATIPRAVVLALLAAPLLFVAGYGVYAAGGGADGFAAFACRYSGASSFWAWLDPHPRDWLGDGDIALYSIMFMGFPWIGTISMLIFYAGLQAIPTSVLESARLDGAGGLRRFFSIDFPLILGQFKLLLILGIIGGIQGFQSVLLLTYGGPGKSTNMPGLGMYNYAFRHARLGYGTAVGVAMFIVILAITYVNIKYIRPSAEEGAE
jgi:ABC-type sugar transport system permease subunit